LLGRRAGDVGLLVNPVAGQEIDDLLHAGGGSLVEPPAHLGESLGRLGEPGADALFEPIDPPLVELVQPAGVHAVHAERVDRAGRL